MNENEVYRYAKDLFYIPGIKRITEVMPFNNGMDFLVIDDSNIIRAKYGIQIRFIDTNGKRKYVKGFGYVLFNAPQSGEECTGITVSVDSEPEYIQNFNEVTVKCKISIHTN